MAHQRSAKRLPCRMLPTGASGLPHLQSVQMEAEAIVASRGNAGHLTPVPPQRPALTHLHPPERNRGGTGALVAGRGKQGEQSMFDGRKACDWSHTPAPAADTPCQANPQAPFLLCRCFIRN